MIYSNVSTYGRYNEMCVKSEDEYFEYYEGCHTHKIREDRKYE
jgi:hypothetical protein